MKIAVFICLCAYAYAFYNDMETATLNIDDVLQSPEETRKYLDCFLDKQPCTKQMEGYKRHITEFLGNNCKNCSPEQKHIIEDFVLNIFVKYPDDMAQMRAKYDPDGKNMAKFTSEIAKY